MSSSTADTLGSRLRGARERPLEALTSPIVWIVVAALVAAATLVLDRARSDDSLPESFTPFYEAGASAFASDVADEPLRSWSFADGAPKTWTSIGRVFSPPRGNAASVRTGSQTSGYQLASPVTTLPAGEYQVVVDGGVDRGGISIGALDPDRETFLSTSNFWSGQRRVGGGMMATAFRLERPTRVRVMLSNWVPEPMSSRWRISRVSIGPLPEPRAIPQARAVQPDYLRVYTEGQAPPLSEVSGKPAADWDFSLQLPAGWRPSGPPLLSNRAGGLDVLTTQSKHDYQLVGPPTKLGPGRYSVVVDGSVVRGGLMLGVADAATERWLDTSLFWSGQRLRPGEKLGLDLELDRPTRVRVVLANWAPEPNRSSWSLQGVRILGPKTG